MTAPGERIRVVVVAPGEGEDRAAVVVARGLRDAGMEVVYAWRHRSVEQLADVVVQEDADAVGLPVLPAQEAALPARLAAALADRGTVDVLVFACGTDAGLPWPVRLFAPDTPPAEIADWLRTEVDAAGG
ncbi:cobalamin-dependent protein [Geodermatophilus sp. DSM 45219]|uniref:cobalamin-dependent protein n=1 Tax=Geodermatophilus sp. DSM 45219 TaxID=1881103 RepID=UPI00088BC980|nr:cobalamin-dependent protein [Geodermatophilus sp. DSM 45219]SDO34838.1 methylmalonyl-CoA mutase, C-terminal domain [Geodermatophilus sp. DSM 45219]